jgi:ABC-type nitrate/sulfonate/bicarbonate transport system permease component
MPADAPSSFRRWLATRGAADLLVVAALIAWELTARTFPAGIFPTPLNVLKTLVGFPTDPEFLENALASGARVWLAVCVSVLLGTAIALLPRYVRWTNVIVNDVVIPFFASFPGVAWGIIGTIWFGLTFQATAAVQVLIILPFTLVNVAEGIKAIGAEELEMAKSFGRRKWAILWRVELPLLRPFILAGARIAYGVCWKVSLVAELFGAKSGLGFMMQQAMDFGSVDEIIAICLSIVVFVALGEWLIWAPLARRYGGVDPRKPGIAPRTPTPVEASAAA